jgi:integrase
MTESQTVPSATKTRRNGPMRNAQHRSLRISEWPRADQEAWANACRPGLRLRIGGAASHLAEVSRATYVQRYGAFLGFLERTGRFDRYASPAGHVTEENVKAYIESLQLRVRSVTTWNCISKLRCAAKLIAPGHDFSWLLEFEDDLVLIMEPRPKFDRLVLANVLAEAGLTLVAEAEQFSKSDWQRAMGVRNGFMIALLALCPIRLKNFAALELDSTIRVIDGAWWIILPPGKTKTGRPDERQISDFLKSAIDGYVSRDREILARGNTTTNAFWLSATSGEPMTYKNIGILISKLTRLTVCVDVSPHLFRTAGASTAATYRGEMPHLASALLGHTDPRVTEERYNRATSMSAAHMAQSSIHTGVSDYVCALKTSSILIS